MGSGGKTASLPCLPTRAGRSRPSNFLRVPAVPFRASQIHAHMNHSGCFPAMPQWGGQPRSHYYKPYKFGRIFP